jgi:hypothetical protein
LIPVADKPETIPTATAVSISEAGKDGIIFIAIGPITPPKIPQIGGIHFLFSLVAFIISATRKQIAVIEATPVSPYCLLCTSLSLIHIILTNVDK